MIAAFLLAGCAFPTVAEQPMAFRHLTVADGLSQNTVMDVHQDRYGFLWLATENGLDRWDGYQIRRYQRGQPSRGELANDYVWQIAEDDAGDLWLATEGGGIAHWQRDSDRFEHFRNDPADPASLSSDRVRALLFVDGGLWAGTTDGGLNRLDPQTGRVTRYVHDPADATSLPGNAVYDLLQDASGRLWVATDDGLAWTQPGTGYFVRIEPSRNNPAGLTSQRIRALHEDRHGTLWVGTFGGGLHAINPRTGRIRNYRHDPADPASLSHDHVRTIFEDDAGRLWIGTADGLNLHDRDEDGFFRYRADTSADGLSDSYVMTLDQDERGVLWIGTRTGGANWWNSRAWEFGHFQADWLARHSATAFAASGTSYWAGTFGGGLTRLTKSFDVLERLSTRSEPALTDDHVMSLLHDRRGALWIGTMSGGLNRLSADGQRVDQVPLPGDADGQPSGIMSMHEDDRGELWIGTFGDGVARLDPVLEQGERLLTAEATPCGTQGRAFADGTAETLGVASEDGLCRLDRRTGLWSGFRHREDDPDALPADSVYALHRDAKGRLWAGTGGGGLARIIEGDADDTVRFESWTRRDGLSSNVIYGIQSDHLGRLWISGNNGIARFDPDTGSVRNYRRAHGLQGDEFHYGAAFRAGDGRLFFGGANGFNAFYPHFLSDQLDPPAVALTRVTSTTGDLRPGGALERLDGLELDYEQRSVTFEFAVLAYTDPDSNRYAYQLRGFDDGWVEAGTRRSTTYTNLDPGRYELLVRGAGADGVWNEAGISLPIAVAPPAWATPWAYAAYVMLAAGALWALFRAQRRRLRQETAYRQRLEQEVALRTSELAESNQELIRASAVKGEFLARMSHEIRSPMNGILGMAELLSLTELNPKQRKYTSTILHSGRSLLAIINDILDFSKLESGRLELDEQTVRLEPLVEEILDIFAADAAKRGIELLAELPPAGVAPVTMDPLRLRQVLINLISNALKFTERGHVRLELTITDGGGQGPRLRFAVHDDGVGIEESQQQHIFDSFTQADASTARRYGGTGLGLAISSELVTLMGGHLMLDSAPGRGSTFSFELAASWAEDPQGADAPALQRAGETLIVCKDAALCKQLARYLGAWGQTVRTVTTSVAALESLRALDSTDQQFVIVDHELPDTSGKQLLEQLLGTTNVRAEHCLLLQPFGRNLDRGRHAVLDKPLKRSELAHWLANAGRSDRPEQAGTEERRPSEHLLGSVLLVEDNPVNQEVFAGMLAELGCQLQVAADGQTGVEQVQMEDFDVVLMDLQLPDFDGLEATRRIRALPEPMGRTPVVALTANASAEDRKRCREAGMDAFLAKPCRLEDLAGTLRRWLDIAPPSVAEQTAEPEPVGGQTEFDELAFARIRRLKRPDGSCMLEHAVSLFTSSAAESVAALRAALDRDDPRALRFHAHKLKSGAANLGAVQLAEACRRLEVLGMNNSLDGAADLVDAIESLHPAAVRWLEAQLRESA